MTEWVMIIITSIYVVATIFICVFNYRSAIAASNQIKLAKAQHELDIRLRLMPCLYVEQVCPTTVFNGTISCEFEPCEEEKQFAIQGDYWFKIQNVGNGPAKEVKYKVPPQIRNPTMYHIVSLPINDSRIVKFSFCGKHGTRQQLSIDIYYSDLLDHKYFQRFSIFLLFGESNVTLESFYISAPSCDKKEYQINKNI